MHYVMCIFRMTWWLYECSLMHFLLCMSWGGSFSIVSDYRLGTWGAISSGGREFFSSLYVQTGSGAHPASCTVGTGNPIPGVKAWPGYDTDHSSPSSAKVKNELELYVLSPQVLPWHVVGHFLQYDMCVASLLTLFHSACVTWSAA
jgi:hypothetical protein